MTVHYLDTHDVPVGDLNRFPGNAKRGRVDEIRTSLTRTGQYRALVVRQHDGGELTILAGNNTHEAAVQLGLPTVRCEIVKCTDAEARRINIADNRLGELGTYDDDSLLALLETIAADPGGLDGTGYTERDLERILADDAPMPAGGDADVDDDVQVSFGVIVTCDTETDQVHLLDRLTREGLRVRALMA